MCGGRKKGSTNRVFLNTAKTDKKNDRERWEGWLKSGPLSSIVVRLTFSKRCTRLVRWVLTRQRRRRANSWQQRSRERRTEDFDCDHDRSPSRGFPLLRSPSCVFRATGCPTTATANPRKSLPSAAPVSFFPNFHRGADCANSRVSTIHGPGGIPERAATSVTLARIFTTATAGWNDYRFNAPPE